MARSTFRRRLQKRTSSAFGSLRKCPAGYAGTRRFAFPYLSGLAVRDRLLGFSSVLLVGRSRLFILALDAGERGFDLLLEAGDWFAVGGHLRLPGSIFDSGLQEGRRKGGDAKPQFDSRFPGYLGLCLPGSP